MSIPIFESCKKRKRMPKLFAFHTFAEPGCPIKPTGPFRDNIRLFLRECAELEDYNVEGMPTWCTLLVSETRNFVVPLYTIEESVNNSARPLCDHCRCTGWSHHYVSKRKYHVIIPADDEWNKPLHDGVFDVQTHLLHGLLHCNGFGHLLCINGIEGGSKFLCGREIMDLWDRVCINLRARKITVEDVSKKWSMDLRLLHGVAYGHPWFGRWDYRFCHGNFGVMEHNYDRAIEVLSTLQLCKIIQDFRSTDKYKEIKQIIWYYRDLSETQLITMGELLRFMLAVKSQASSRRKLIITGFASSLSRPPTKAVPQNKPLVKEKSVRCRKFSTVITNMDSRWPSRRLEYAAEIIVNALKEKKADRSSHGGMTRQEVRDAARLHIGDTGLLDYVLKSMNNVIVGSYIVRRAVNPSNRVLEYSIQELANGVLVNETEPEAESEPGFVPEPTPVPTRVAGADVYSDMIYLYTNILFEYPESDTVELATQVVLDTKHFVKEWPFRDEDDQLLRFICRIMPSLSDDGTELTAIREFQSPPPSEFISVPLHATLGELKRAIETALRDTYCTMDQFVVTEIENTEGMEDGEVLFGAVESGSEVWARGYGIDLGAELRYEGGTDNWTVRCECGARDDDGERMVACDICEVWQHTRCIGIEDADAVPPLYVCNRCCASLVPQKTQPSFGFECAGSLLLHPMADYGNELLYEQCLDWKM
ncbi:PHD finger protein MALE MEIOCYTE DEATH 1 [Malania oleifera]|uniref:PHD finger protein MALE MEIOCYTE DEATH 1 n=1 Tax=Malania oleifera TaxID=397392 RepID=UPI0025AE973E|nr:PHD finger protein MALE MEIOCYTE DEATH 1 [Malania oleifera]